MTLEERRTMIHQLLESAVRLQRDSWDLTMLAEKLAGDVNLLRLVVEFAGEADLGNGELVDQNIRELIDELISDVG